jgi:hypothetical protein
VDTKDSTAIVVITAANASTSALKIPGHSHRDQLRHRAITNVPGVQLRNVIVAQCRATRS